MPTTRPFSPVRAALPALAALLAACSDATSPAEARMPGDIGVSVQELQRHAATLAHDSMCGRLAASRYEYQAGEYIADRFARAGLAPGGVDGTYFQRILTATGPVVQLGSAVCSADSAYGSRNVIGVLGGMGELANEWVVLGAHYDHLGWEVAGDETLVLNGADDNASGTAVVLEVARLLAAWIEAHPEAAAPRRTLVFQAYGAEELGMTGSEFYAGSPLLRPDSVYAMVNLDMVGRLRNGTVAVAGLNTADAWPALLETHRPGDLAYFFSDASLQRSDQWSFITLLGAPAIHIFTGLHEEYHTPRDDTDLLNWDGMRDIGRLVLGLLWDLASRPGPL